MKITDFLENLLFTLIVGLMTGLPLLAFGLFGYLIFHALALSNFSVTDKAVIFVFSSVSFIITGMYIDVAWNAVKSEKTKEEIAKEIKEKILKAKLELVAADVEIKEKDTFSNADALIKLVHKHIKQAKEYLDEVY